MTVLYIALAILLFGVLVGVHELGHFAAAKACGVRVEEFALGMGPAILQKQKGETVYSLRCIPFGGFCAMAGEDEESDDPRAFMNQAAWKRIIILVAGAAMNFLLGLLIVIILYSNAYAFRSAEITGFMDGCPYESSEGLHVGDRFYKIDGQRIYQYYDVSDFLSQGDGTYDLIVLRDGKKVKLNDFALTPLDYPGQTQKMYGFYFGYDEATLGVKLENSWNTTMEFGRWVWLGLKELVRGDVGMKDMAGPVGIVDMMAHIISAIKAATIPNRHCRYDGRDGRAGRVDRRRALQHFLFHGLHRGEPRDNEYAADPGARWRQSVPADRDMDHRDDKQKEARPEV